MNTKKGYIFTAIVVMMLMLCLVKIDAKAANVVESKTEGDITWTMYDDGLLRIEKANKDNICYFDSDTASYDNYKDDINKISIETGVTSIGNEAFKGCSGLVSVRIPDSVTFIGSGVFYECTSLSSISIPSNVTDLNGNIFSGCSKLVTVNIPDSLTIIQNGAFERCISLETLTIPDSVTFIGFDAFNGCTSLTDVKLSSHTAVIEFRAFYNCSSLTSITIPKSVERIGEKAFCYCSSLKNVYASETLLNNTDLQDVFYDTKWLKYRAFPIKGEVNGITFELDSDGNLTLDGTGKFILPTKLKDYADLVKTVIITSKSQSISTDVFWPVYFKNIDKIINQATSSIALDSDNTYSWCNINDTTEPIFSITNGTAVKVNHKLVLHYTIVFDGNGATGSMESKKAIAGMDVVIPQNTFSKNEYLFKNWKYSIGGQEYILKDGDSIKISEYELKAYNVSSITLVAQWDEDLYNESWYKDYKYSVGSSTIILEKYIGSEKNIVVSPYVVISGKSYKVRLCQDVFAENSNITFVCIKDGVTFLTTECWENGKSREIYNSHIFFKCKNLKNVILPSGMNCIGENAFALCENLENVHIPDSVTRIESGAFDCCFKLAIKDLPDSITYIGYSAFQCCESLELDALPQNITKIDQHAFSGCKKLGISKLPEGLEEICYGAFSRCAGIKSIILPSTINKLGAEAFALCSNLTYIEYYGSKLDSLSTGVFKLDSNEVLQTELLTNNSLLSKYDWKSDNRSVTMRKNECEEACDAELVKFVEKVSPDAYGCRYLRYLKCKVCGREWEMPSYYFPVSSMYVDPYVDSYPTTEKYGMISYEGSFGKFTPYYKEFAMIKLNETELEIDVNQSKRISAEVWPYCAPNRNIVWESSDPSILEIDSLGNIKALSVGIANVTATVLDDSSIDAVTCKVKVIDPKTKDIISQNNDTNNTKSEFINSSSNSPEFAHSKEVTGITLNKKKIVLSKGKKIYIIASITPSDATNKDIRWTSSNPKVASVDKYGKIKALKNGKTVITATTINGEKKATCKITVTTPVKNVKLSKKTYSIKKGKTLELKPIISPITASNHNVTYKSSNKKIATIDKNGKVKGIKKGKVKITVTTKDGKKKATCIVNVK